MGEMHLTDFQATPFFKRLMSVYLRGLRHIWNGGDPWEPLESLELELEAREPTDADMALLHAWDCAKEDAESVGRLDEDEFDVVATVEHALAVGMSAYYLGSECRVTCNRELAQLAMQAGWWASRIADGVSD